MKKITKTIALACCGILCLLGGYAAYVFGSYTRLDDKLPLFVDAADNAAKVPIGKTLKAVSYNVGFGAYSRDYSFFMDGGRESRCRTKESGIYNISQALHIAKEQQADLYFFQEVDLDGTRSYHVNQYNILQNGMSPTFSSVFAQNYDSPYLFWPPFSPHGANTSGLATFSSFTISKAVRRQLPVEDSVMKIADLDRCYAVHRLPCENGKELVIYNVHLSAYTSDGTIANAQLQMLFTDMQAEYKAGNYCIAGGDFNKDLAGDATGTEYTWAQPIPAELIPSELKLIAPSADSLKSCRLADKAYNPDTSFTITVDGFIVSKNVSYTTSSVIDTAFEYSDHNPVNLSFCLIP